MIPMTPGNPLSESDKQAVKEGLAKIIKPSGFTKPLGSVYERHLDVRSSEFLKLIGFKQLRHPDVRDYLEADPDAWRYMSKISGMQIVEVCMFRRTGLTITAIVQ